MTTSGIEISFAR